MALGTIVDEPVLTCSVPSKDSSFVSTHSGRKTVKVSLHGARSSASASSCISEFQTSDIFLLSKLLRRGVFEQLIGEPFVLSSVATILDHGVEEFLADVSSFFPPAPFFFSCV